MVEISHLETSARRLRERLNVSESENLHTEPAHSLTVESSELVETIAGRYHLVRQIGRGRLGPIFEARDSENSRANESRGVAVQLLDKRFATNWEFVKRLKRGVTALQAGRHPNVIELFELGRHQRTVYLTLGLLEGASLRLVLDDVSRLPLDEAMAMVRGIGHGVAYLHAKAVVHGRIEPRSVFITEDLQVKLIDIVPLPTVAGRVNRKGGPGASSQSGFSDDIFGVACLTYEMLMGRHPFNSSAPEEASRAGLQLLRPDVLNNDQWAVLARSMAADPAERASSIGEFLREFGIDGTESLQQEDNRIAAPPPVWASNDIPIVSEVVPLVAVEPATERRPVKEHSRSAWPAFGAVLLLAVLGGLTWRYQGELRMTVTDAIEAIRPIGSATLVASTNMGGGSGALPSLNSAEVDQLGGELKLVAIPAIEEPPADAENPPELDTAIASDAAGRVELVTDSIATADVTVSPVALPSSEAPSFAFASSAISVAENASAARIGVRRSGDLSEPAAVVWWTNELSAAAGEDYADLGQQIERFAAQEDIRTLFVPLINDSLPEETKSFSVYLRLQGTRGEENDVEDAMRVDIVDDD